MRSFSRGFGARRRSFSPARSGGSFSGNRGFSRNRFANRGARLNPLMFVRKAEVVEEMVYTPVHQFSDFNLIDALQKNVAAKGYSKPTPIQDQAIGLLMEGKDVVGLANTGTGKTAAFLLPLINKVFKDRSQKVLIVAPTRELAVQIKAEFQEFVMGIGMSAALCIGGASMGQQLGDLRRNPGFVIGTPGRIKDLTKRGAIRMDEYNNVVLDEADRMLDMGFINDVRDIISRLPIKRQSLFFSATLPDETKRVMESFLHNPVTVSVKTGTTARNIDQDIIHTAGKDKVTILHELLIKDGFDKVLVFGRTKWGVNKLQVALQERGFKVASIHGNKTQGQRQKALQELKENRVQILLATDIASRGLDFQDVTHVINYDTPESYEDYVHRIGRTGRADKKGVALTFVE